LLSTVLPGIHRVPGYRGVYLMRRDIADGVEFTTLTFFESLDAVRAFAGERYDVAVVPDEARRLLLRFDETSQHFDIVLAPEQAGSRSGRRC
jgi:heme-degrading monooxygenase HmoA